MRLINIFLETESGYIRTLTINFTEEERATLKKALELQQKIVADQQEAYTGPNKFRGFSGDYLLTDLFGESGRLVEGSEARFTDNESTLLLSALGMLVEDENDTVAMKLHEEIIEQGYK